MSTEFRLPELGENIAKGDLIKVLVAVGDVISRDQGVIELETEKATLEVPSSVDGKVESIHVKAGEQVKVGQLILTVVDGAEAGPERAEQAQAPEGRQSSSRDGEEPQAEKAEAEGEGSTTTQPDASEPGQGSEVGQTVESGEPGAPGELEAEGGATSEFRLPELGENVEKGDLLKVLVSVGDLISKDQPVIELETDKATIEVPSSVSGKVKEIHVKAGERVQVGQLILTVEGGTPRATKKPRQAEQKTVPGKPTTSAAKAPAKAEARIERAATQPAEQQGPAERQGPGEAAQRAPVTAAQTAPQAQATPRADKRLVPAAPSVRRMARELGVEIAQVPGRGPAGRISAEDVKAYIRKLNTARAAPGAPAAIESRLMPDFARWGLVEREPMRAVRRATASHLAYAWVTVPRVTQHDKADITEVEQFRKQHAGQAEARGGKLTITAIALKVVASALHKFPQFAASIDPAREEIIYKKYCHIGVAVDTDRGLLVPVIRDVDQKNIMELSVELAAAAEKARNRKLTPEEMEGGVFSISNLGGIGGTSFTPIVNWPEVAILGMSRSSTEPVWTDGKFEPRLILPLSLSYDHRMIDGADAARFLRWVAEALEQPFLMPFEG